MKKPPLRAVNSLCWVVRWLVAVLLHVAFQLSELCVEIIEDQLIVVHFIISLNNVINAGSRCSSSPA